MMFIKFIQNSLETVSDFENLAKAIGYSAGSSHVGARRLKEMRLKPLLGLDDDEEYFDGIMGARSIVEKLLYYFDADEDLKNEANHSINTISAEVKKQKELNRDICNAIFVDTEFQRVNEPLFILAFLENQRWIRNFGSLCSFPLEEQIKIVSKIVKQHYKDTKGVLPIWGTIKSYMYKYAADKPCFVFDKNGELVEETKKISPVAILLVGGKKFPISEIEAR